MPLTTSSVFLGVVVDAFVAFVVCNGVQFLFHGQTLFITIQINCQLIGFAFLVNCIDEMK